MQTREWVLPSKDTAATDWITENARQDTLEPLALWERGRGEGELGGEGKHSGEGKNGGDGGISPYLNSPHPNPLPQGEGTKPWTNRLIYGDKLLAMAALLAGDETTPSLRGRVDLIYIDPPFDSKADYRTKVTLPSVRPELVEGRVRLPLMVRQAHHERVTV